MEIITAKKKGIKNSTSNAYGLNAHYITPEK
jgi:hypothetical protein